MSFLIFIIALSLMILVHELGHFLMARKRGLKVEEFGFGYPPRIFGIKRGEVTYSLNLIPFGGFVRIWGMEEEVKKDKRRAFYNQSAPGQFLILIAGVVMNFALAVLVFGAIYGIKGVPQPIDKVKVVEIQADSPASQAEIAKDSFIVGIKKDDQIIQVKTSQGLIENINNYLDQEVILVFESGEEKSLVPRLNPPEDQGPLGVVIVDEDIVHLPFYRQIPLGIWYGLKEGFFWGTNIFIGFLKMLINIATGQPLGGVAGPIGIYKISSQILQENGLLSAIHFFAVISINLAVVNLIPIPGTDGWHLCLLALEKARGREVSWGTKRKINQAAMVFLLLLFFLILVFDIKRFVLG